MLTFIKELHYVNTKYTCHHVESMYNSVNIYVIIFLYFYCSCFTAFLAQLLYTTAELIGWVVICPVRRPATIRFSTYSSKPLAGFSSNLMGMYLGWVSTKFVQLATLQ